MYLHELQPLTSIEIAIREAHNILEGPMFSNHPEYSRKGVSAVNHSDSRHGSQIFGGNKGVMIKAWKALKKIVTFLGELDPTKPHDENAMQDLISRMADIRRMLMVYKERQNGVR